MAGIQFTKPGVYTIERAGTWFRNTILCTSGANSPDGVGHMLFALLAYGIGALNVLGALYILYLRGGNATLLKMNKILSAEQAAADANLRKLAADVQAMEKPYVIQIGDPQAVTIANIVLNRVEQIIAAREQAALNKLN